MRLCKYCDKPIEDNEVWNPDKNGDGYHSSCLTKMQFEARDNGIYHKGYVAATNRLKSMIEEIEALSWYCVSNGELLSGAQNQSEALYKADDIWNIIEKYVEG